MSDDGILIIGHNLMISPIIKIEPTQSTCQSRVVYEDNGDNGFLVTLPKINTKEQVAELIVSDYMSLTVGINSGLVYRFEGLTSKAVWTPCELEVPVAGSGRAVCIVQDLDLQKGTGYYTPLAGLYEQYDSNKKILRIGKPDKDTFRIRIFENVIIGLRQERLNSVYVLDI